MSRYYNIIQILKKDKVGNFFTNKRIAHYWLDSHEKNKSDTTFAFYNEITSIDTFYEVPDTFGLYMKITKNDSMTFRVYTGGTKGEIKSFFKEAIRVWKKN